MNNFIHLSIYGQDTALRHKGHKVDRFLFNKGNKPPAWQAKVQHNQWRPTARAASTMWINIVDLRRLFRGHRFITLTSCSHEPLTHGHKLGQYE